MNLQLISINFIQKLALLLVNFEQLIVFFNNSLASNGKYQVT